MTFNSSIVAVLYVCLVFCVGPTNVVAFMQPKAFVSTNLASLPTVSGDIALRDQSKALNMLPGDLSQATSLFISDEAAAVAGLEGLRTFFVVITALVFGFAGLTFVTAAFIVPQAAKQLEQDTKRLKPGLWEEFEEKLQEGETMATRPDLLQELGNIMQPIIIKDFEDTANSKDVVDVKKSNLVDEDQWKD
jgi:hypothetical protein